MPALFDSGSLPATRSANAKISSAMYASLTTGSTFVDGTGGRTPRILAARSRASCRRFAMITDSPIIYSPLSWARYIYHRAIYITLDVFDTVRGRAYSSGSISSPTRSPLISRAKERASSPHRSPVYAHILLPLEWEARAEEGCLGGVGPGNRPFLAHACIRLRFTGFELPRTPLLGTWVNRVEATHPTF